MPYDRDCLHVIFSSDDRYARHMGVAAYSLLEHNRDFREVCVYMIDNKISPENRKKLEETVMSFPNGRVVWIDFTAWLGKLKLNLPWQISMSSYARLFVASMIPESVGRILYLDCDMIICDSLRTLWETDLHGAVIGAVQDFVNDQTKGAVGLKPQDQYLNAGMLLIDMDAWRARHIEQACLAFIEAKEGRVTHHDQGVLNGVLHDQCRFVPIRYDLMTIHYIFDRRKLCKFFCDHADFYSVEEINEAKRNPAILHYTPSFTSRPWVKSCKHPLRRLYHETLDKTPWRGTPDEKDGAKWYVRLINWRYRHLPY